MDTSTVQTSKSSSYVGKSAEERQKEQDQTLRLKSLEIATRTKQKDQWGNSDGSHNPDTLIAAAQKIFNFLNQTK